MSINRINTNFDAMFARNSLQKLELSISKSTQRLSTGKKIITAADGPMEVGMLATATAQLRGNMVAQQNIQQAISMFEYYDTGVQSIVDKLLQMRDIAMQQANGAVLSTAQKSALNTQYSDLYATLDATSDLDGFTWNGKKVMAEFDAAMGLQVGPNTADAITIAANTYKDMIPGAANAYGTVIKSAIASAGVARSAMTQIDTALSNISTQRARVGSLIQRLEMDLENQFNMETVNASTVATIGDADLANEITALASSQILASASTAMLGQANLQSQMLVGLLNKL